VKGIDTFKSCLSIAGQIKGAGYSFVARYLSDGVGTIHAAFTEIEAAHLSSLGLSLVSIAEFGKPDVASYFTPEQADLVIDRSVRFAALAGQKSGAIFVTLDGDFQVPDVQNFVSIVHAGLKATGFLLGLYGNGICLKWAKDAGYAHYTWLCESTGFCGYDLWKSHADIVQVTTTTVAGIDVDTDFSQSMDFGQWRLK